jgi:surface antigen
MGLCGGRITRARPEEDAILLRSDVLWRNGGRLLSVALLGGLALNAGGAPMETMEAYGHSPAALTSWLTLENGWLCRSWSAPLAASAASIPPVVTSSAANATPNPAGVVSLSFTAQSQTSAKGANVSQSAQAVDSVNSLSSLGSTLGALAQGTQSNTQGNVKHCATRWHISADGRLISDASAWVPNPTGDWPTLNAAPLQATTLRASSPLMALAGSAHKTTPSAIASVLVIHTIPPKPVASAPQATTVYTSAGGISAWTPVPGHPTYSMSDFAGDPHSSEFGVCTWWAWYARRDEPQLGTLGVASNWLNNARAQGMSVGYAPAAGATVVFQPGVEGAGGSGHVAHVVQLLSGGWFIISEMNFYWNGGGWGRVDYRYAHAGSGVAFIY